MGSQSMIGIRLADASGPPPEMPSLPARLTAKTVYASDEAIRLGKQERSASHARSHRLNRIRKEKNTEVKAATRFEPWQLMV